MSSTWQRFVEVPHRAYFAAGVISILVLGMWWSIALPLAGVTTQPATLVHGLIMPMAIFPPFMLGFVFTAGPRWLATQAPTGNLLLALGQVGGLVLALAGFSMGGAVPVLGLCLMLLVGLRAAWLWYRCIRSASATADARHGWCILAAMLIGQVALLNTIGWVLTGDGQLWLLARDLVVWGWIVPIFLTVAHRMVPFFTQAVIPQREIWRPIGLLYGWLAGCAALVVADVTGLPQLGMLAAMALAVATGMAALRWAGGRIARGACGGNRLLAMLHFSLVWLPIGFVLLALSYSGLVSDSAALHAFAMGFCFTLMVGFVTRVTLGHSGRALMANDTHWRCYLALHGIAVLRVLFALLPVPQHALHGLAVLWLLIIAVWAWQVLPVYWKPRADGNPG